MSGITTTTSQRAAAEMVSSLQRMQFVLAPRLGQITVVHGGDAFHAHRAALEDLEQCTAHEYVRTSSERRDLRRVIAMASFEAACVRKEKPVLVDQLAKALCDSGFSSAERQACFAREYASWARHYPEATQVAIGHVRRALRRLAAQPDAYPLKTRIQRSLHDTAAYLESLTGRAP